MGDLQGERLWQQLPTLRLHTSINLEEFTNALVKPEMRHPQVSSQYGVLADPVVALPTAGVQPTSQRLRAFRASSRPRRPRRPRSDSPASAEQATTSRDRLGARSCFPSVRRAGVLFNWLRPCWG
jgi:hypothetical protein